MNTIIKYLLCFLCLLSISLIAHAQHDHHHHRDKPLPCLNKTFYVQVHVVVDRFGQAGPVDRVRVDSVLALASEYFAPICAQFKACAYDTIYDYNYNLIAAGGRESSEMIAKFHVPNRINLYLVNSFYFNCGYSIFESIQIPRRAALFVSKRSCFDPRVVAHELGHLFGLLHTYHNRWEELVDGSNCLTAGDKLCDTPADPFIPRDTLRVYVNDCEFIHPRRDPNGQYYQPLVGNIMSAYPSRCDCGFTYDQLELMANNYLNSNVKIW